MERVTWEQFRKSAQELENEIIRDTSPWNLDMRLLEFYEYMTHFKENLFKKKENN